MAKARAATKKKSVTKKVATPAKPSSKKPASTKPSKATPRRAASSLDAEVLKEPAPKKIKKTARTQPAAGAHADLLRAILENPDDDRARIVYADALQEDGDPRGEYIALSLAGGKAAATKAKELLDAHRGKAWQNFGAKGARYSWNRGFIHEVGCAAKVLAAAGPLMFEVEPIQSLSIYGHGDGQMATIVGFPLRITELSLSLNKREDAVALANAKTLGNITRLGLGSFSDDDAEVLAPSTAMPKLARLTASLGSLTHKGMEALAAGPFLANIKQLYLHQHDLDARAMTALAGAPWASNVEELGLAENPIGDVGVAELVQGNFPKLRTLDLANNYRQEDQPTFGEGAADALVAAATTTLKNLKVLDLSWNIAGAPLARVKAAYGDRLRMRRAEDRFG